MRPLRDGLNLYSYCANNPVYYVDPDGHMCDPAGDRIQKKQGNREPASGNEKQKKKQAGKNGQAPKRYYQDPSGKWYRPNGQPASDAEVGVKRPGKGKTPTKVVLPDKPHTNGTKGHWETILDEVDAMKKSGNYEVIYVNKGLGNEIPGAKPNRRPDIMGVRKDGKIDQVEVPSKTDTPEDLIKRMKDNQKIIGKRAGKIKIRTIGEK